MKTKYLLAGATLLLPLATMAAGCSARQPSTSQPAAPTTRQGNPNAYRRPANDTASSPATSTTVDDDVTNLDKQVDTLNNNDFDPNDLPKDYNQLQ